MIRRVGQVPMSGGGVAFFRKEEGHPFGKEGLPYLFVSGYRDMNAFGGRKDPCRQEGAQRERLSKAF